VACTVYMGFTIRIRNSTTRGTENASPVAFGQALLSLLPLGSVLGGTKTTIAAIAHTRTRQGRSQLGRKLNFEAGLGARPPGLGGY